MSDTLTQCSALMGNCDTLIASWLGILLIPFTILVIWWQVHKEIRQEDTEEAQHMAPLYRLPSMSHETDKEDVPAPGVTA